MKGDLKALGTNLVKTKEIVVTTDKDGDIYLGVALPSIAVAAVLLRNRGNDTYAELGTIILGCVSGDNASNMGKIIDDKMLPVANRKVAVKVYYINAKFITS